MEFDSPEAAKEFPGLYMADSGKVDDSLEYTDDGEKKKGKKEKKKDKDKGYSALAGESSQDEDDALDTKSPGKVLKIKAFSKLSGKRKDKDKKSEKSEKDVKKAEKEAKEKRKSEEKERKSIEKELNSTPGPSVIRPQIPFSGAHLMRNNSQSSQSAILTPQSSVDSGTPVKRNILSESVKDSTPSKPPKEKSAGFNVFLNAPAPLLSKLKDRDNSKDKSSKKEHKDKEKKHKEKDKDKEKGESKSSKKEKEHKEKDKKEKDKDHSQASGIAKVKLKLMRSKNSLEDPTGDVPHITSHQFPEDPEALAKEIKKYEGLLEQAHTQLKSSKKISKKQEEQLWELQRTLTQLKRKLRSINALSCASAHFHSHSSNSEREHPIEHPVSPAQPIFKKCDSIDGQTMAKKLANNNELRISASIDSGAAIPKEKEPVVVTSVLPTPSVPIEIPKIPMPPSVPIEIPKIPMPPSVPVEIPKIPMPPSKNSYSKTESITIATSPPTTLASPPKYVTVPATEAAPSAPALPSNGESTTPAAMSPVNSGVTVPESSNNFASPRPSIDTIVQVHHSSVEGDLSDDEVPQNDDDTENDMEELHDEGPVRMLSLSNHDSQEDSKESIEAVLDDANKMIGSMHEELMFEGELDVVSGDARLRSGDHDSSITVQDESEVELFTNDLELDEEATLLSNEEPCPDPFSMPVFDTAEYIAIENEALSLFNEQLKDDLQKEQVELEEALQRLPPKPQNHEDESSEPSQNETDITDLITVWTKLKSENVVLWDNVNRLRHALAACRVDEFRLQTRLNYMEAKTSALSPVTTTTPLQTEG